MIPEVKTEISRAALELVKYIHENKFEEILVSGGSNQLSRSLITLAWQSEYKGKAMPKIQVLDAESNKILYKLDTNPSDEKDKVEEWITAHLPMLEEIKNRRVCYVDDFAITGGKYISLKNRFEQLGFSNLQFAFFAATPISELAKDVFVGTLDPEVVRELYSLSLKIKGGSALSELLAQIEISPKENRNQAISSLKEIGQNLRLK